jgi:hypothetical protein
MSIRPSAFHPFAFKEEIVTDHATSNILVGIVSPNTMGTRCLKIQFWLSGNLQTGFDGIVTEFRGLASPT